MNSPAHAAESLIDDVVSNEDGNHEKINFDSVSDRSYFLRGFQFYTIDIKSTPKRMLDAIIRECEAIEKACWVPQENFYRYALQKDLLTYVMKDGKMAAFQIASYWILGQDFIFDLDETMVMKEYRGNNLAFALAAINCRTFYLKILKSKNIKKMTFIGLTPNLRLVNVMDRIRHTIRLLDTSFNPSQNLIRIHDYILEKKGAKLVHDDYPFFLRSAFPGSLKPSDHTHRTSERIKKMLPPGLDFNGRGDAFLFLATFKKYFIWPFHVVLLLKALGARILTDSKIGLMNRKKYDHIDRYLSHDKNLDSSRG